MMTLAYFEERTSAMTGKVAGYHREKSWEQVPHLLNHTSIECRWDRGSRQGVCCLFFILVLPWRQVNLAQLLLTDVCWRPVDPACAHAVRRIMLDRADQRVRKVVQVRLWSTHCTALQSFEVCCPHDGCQVRIFGEGLLKPAVPSKCSPRRHSGRREEHLSV